LAGKFARNFCKMRGEREKSPRDFKHLPIFSSREFFALGQGKLYAFAGKQRIRLGVGEKTTREF
jgi:hypothetical protein